MGKLSYIRLAFRPKGDVCVGFFPLGLACGQSAPALA